MKPTSPACVRNEARPTPELGRDVGCEEDRIRRAEEWRDGWREELVREVLSRRDAWRDSSRDPSRCFSRCSMNNSSSKAASGAAPGASGAPVLPTPFCTGDAPVACSAGPAMRRAENVTARSNLEGFCFEDQGFVFYLVHFTLELDEAARTMAGGCMRLLLLWVPAVYALRVRNPQP
jgi:hypothetical protein